MNHERRPSILVAAELATPRAGTLSMVSRQIDSEVVEAASARVSLTVWAGQTAIDEADALYQMRVWQAATLNLIRDRRQVELMEAVGERIDTSSSPNGAGRIRRYYLEAEHMPVGEVATHIDEIVQEEVEDGNPQAEIDRVYAEDLKTRLSQLANPIT